MRSVNFSALGVGGELIQAAALESGKTEVITEAAKKYVEIVCQAKETKGASLAK
jgi:2-keto-3-deoxy-6-phosphogluconate aldolase